MNIIFVLLKLETTCLIH